MKRIVLLVLAVCASFTLMAQELSGIITKGGKPKKGLTVTLLNGGVKTTSDKYGRFYFQDAKPGDVLQVIGSDQQFSAFREAIESELLGQDVELEKREMKLRQLIIGADSPFVGKTLIESRIRDIYSCMVVGLEEGKESLSPYSPNRRFREGDIIWIVGEQESLDALFNL